MNNPIPNVPVLATLAAMIPDNVRESIFKTALFIGVGFFLLALIFIFTEWSWFLFSAIVGIVSGILLGLAFISTVSRTTQAALFGGSIGVGVDTALTKIDTGKAQSLFTKIGEWLTVLIEGLASLVTGSGLSAPPQGQIAVGVLVAFAMVVIILLLSLIFQPPAASAGGSKSSSSGSSGAGGSTPGTTGKSPPTPKPKSGTQDP